MKRTKFLAALVALAFAASLFADERAPEVEMLRPGVRLSLVAEHPDIATPTGVDVDASGNVWAVASHTHMPPENYAGPKHDEVLVFGPGGERRVFYNATHHTMDLELGADGWVYLAERDRIFRVKDFDGDGKGDLEEDLATLATEADYPHNGLSALAWHPDGDLCFGLGENFAKGWTLTGKDGTEVVGAGEGGVFRCRPDGKGLRRIARGMWNPFGLLVREDGEMFVGENDPGERPPCRLLHIVEDGDYGYQRAYGGEAHHPFVCWNGQLRGTLPMIHPSGEAPCGVARLGRGLMVPSWSDHRIDFYPLVQKGASYTSGRIALVHGSRYFRPVCIARDRSRAEGEPMTWYLTDWVDGRYQVHGYGRLWKLEIDLNEADWVGPLDLQAPTEEAKLAAKLRGEAHGYSRGELLKFARDEDPFVSRAALVALSREAPGWKPKEVSGMPAQDRVWAVQALKLSSAPAESWVRRFLADEDAEVRFETLRWIADGRLEGFLPEVEKMLGGSELDYRLFEAAIATWNTLMGKPEAGIRDTEMLMSRVQDPKSSPRVRGYALRLLPSQPRSAAADGKPPVRKFPKGLTLELLQELLEVGDEALSLEVVRALGNNPEAGQKMLAKIAADSKRSAGLRAEAVAGLGAVAEGHRSLLVEMAGAGGRAIREEALRGLRSVTLTPGEIASLKKVGVEHPESADAVRATLEPASLAAGRPALADTGGWLKRLDAVEGAGDPDAGSRIFHHARLGLCSNCHRHGGRGNVVGPDLSGLSGLSGRGDRKWLLDSILNPNLEIAPEYLPRTITLRDGTTFTGIRLRSSTREAMRDTNGQNRSFNRDDIVSMEELQMSFMPGGLPDTLTDRELRDLLAYLETSN